MGIVRNVVVHTVLTAFAVWIGARCGVLEVHPERIPEENSRKVRQKACKSV